MSPNIQLVDNQVLVAVHDWTNSWEGKQSIDLFGSLHVILAEFEERIRKRLHPYPVNVRHIIQNDKKKTEVYALPNDALLLKLTGQINELDFECEFYIAWRLTSTRLL